MHAQQCRKARRMPCLMKSRKRAAQEMAVYEQFVMGMLSNLDVLPLERIHNLLKMFVTEPPYDKSAEQLAAFLARLVADEKLIMEGSLYRRRPAP